MASPAFRDISTVNDATATNITGTEPTGTAQNDILVAHLYIESDTSVTAPSGWSNTFRSTAALAECNNASGAFRAYWYWIRRGASAPALTWTHSSAFRGMTIRAYSGAVTTEDPWSFIATAVRDDTAARTFPDVSGTTLTADEMLVWGGSMFTGAVTLGTQPTGFTERRDLSTGGSVCMREEADLAQAVAGSTGTVTGGLWTGGSTATATAIMAGLKSVAEAAGGGGQATRSMQQFRLRRTY